MRVVELVTPVTEPQEDDVALVMRDSSPAMVSLKDAVESFAGGSLSTLASRVAELEATRPTILTFASREAFEAAVVADWVTGWTVDHLGVTLEYKRDASGTAIESDNGVKGSPAEEAYVEHYGYGVAAISAMASDRGVVRVLTGFAVPTSVQIDVGVIFEPEAYFTIAAGATVDFRRRIQAPVDQWVIRGDGGFTMASADDTGENARTVEAAWFGVLPTTDTETDMAPRITKMVQGIGGTENVINFAQGRFTISTAVAALPRGTWIKGAGKRRTVFAVTANSFDVFTTGGDVCRFTELNFEVDASKIAWRTSGSYIKILHGECEIKEVRAGSADKNFVILGANAVVENVSGIWGASASSTSSLVSVAGNYASIKGVRSNTTATYGPGCLVDIGTDAVGGIDVVSVQDVFSISPTVAVKVNATAGQVRNVNLSNLQEYMYTGANPASWVDIKATSYAIENVRIDQWQASGRATDAINVEAIGANISGVLIGQGKANGTTGAGVKFTTGTGRQITNIAIDPSADIYSRANPISINGTGTLSWLPVGQPEASQFGIKPGVNIPVGLVEAATRDVASRGQKLYFRGANSAYLFTDTAIFHCSIYGDGSSGKWSTGQETVFKTVGAGTPRQWHDKGTGVPADDISRPLLVAGRSELTVNNIRIDNDAGWEHDILMPATRAVSIERVTTGGASSVSVVFDQTWSDRNTTLMALHPTIVPGAGCNECMTFDCDLGGDVEGLGVIGTVRDPDDYTGTDWLWGWGGASDFQDIGSRVTGIKLDAACDNAAGMVQGLSFIGTSPRVGSREFMLTVDRATRVTFSDSYAEASSGNTAKVAFTGRTAANNTETIVFRNVDWIRNTVWVDGVDTGVSINDGGSVLTFLDVLTSSGTHYQSGMVYGPTGVRPRTNRSASVGTSSFEFSNVRGFRHRSNGPEIWFRTLQDGVTTPRQVWSVGNSQVRMELQKERWSVFVPGITRPGVDAEGELPDDPETATNGLVVTPNTLFPNTSLGMKSGKSGNEWEEVWTPKLRSNTAIDLNAPTVTANSMPLPRGTTRASFVTAVAGGFDPGVGAVIFADGEGYLRVIGATAIADLPGYEPYGDAMLDHWAVVYDSSGTDNTTAINAAWAWCAANGRPCFAGPGTIWHGATLTMPDGLDFRATVYGKTVFKKQSGFNGRQAVSAGFDTYTGADAADTCPADITMIGVKFDGNWMLNDWFAETNSYVNTSGGGFYIYARRYEIDIEVINQAGIGFWSELNGDPESLSDRKKARSRIHVGVTKEEGIIFKGPGDMTIPEMWCFATGTRIFSEREAATTPRVSPTYGLENGGVTDGIVFDGKGAEIGTIHSWAHHSGGPLWTKGKPRLHCELLIGESSAIGPRIMDEAYGHIGFARIHNNKGGWSGLTPGLWPDFKISTTDGFVVGSVWIKPSTNGGDKAQDRLVVDGVNVQVGGGRIEGSGYPGHGVVLGGNYNEVKVKVSACKGAPANGDGISYALKRIAPFSDRTMDAEITANDCDGYFLSSGTPNQERISLMFRGLTGQVPFSGDAINTGNAQRWNIYGEIDNTRIMSDTTVDVQFDSSTTTEQTLTVAHRLIHMPSLRNIMLSIWDTTTNSQIGGSDAVQYCYVHAVDATNITIKVKMAVAHATDTAPRISARVCI